MKLLKSPTHFWFVVGLVVLAVATRVFPHLPNSTAVGALALWGGLAFRSRGLNLGLLALVLLITDSFLGFYQGAVWVYLGFAAMAVCGSSLKVEKSLTRLAGGVALGSFLFFALSNFGVWLSMDLYPKTLEGLAQCYTMALPFYGKQLIGETVYNLMVAGAYLLTFKVAFKSYALK